MLNYKISDTDEFKQVKDKLNMQAAKVISKDSNIDFKHANDKFNIEAAKDVGVPVSNNSNLSTTKIIYGYELGLKNKL